MRRCTLYAAYNRRYEISAPCERSHECFRFFVALFFFSHAGAAVQVCALQRRAIVLSKVSRVATFNADKAVDVNKYRHFTYTFPPRCTDLLELSVRAANVNARGIDVTREKGCGGVRVLERLDE